MLKQYEGPPGSVSFPTTLGSFFGNQMVVLFEAVDPRGHRKGMDCFKNYYKHYSKEEPFSGLHFFDWLDFGSRELLLEKNNTHKSLRYVKGDDKCYKKDFKFENVHCFGEEERLAHEVFTSRHRKMGRSSLQDISTTSSLFPR